MSTPATATPTASAVPKARTTGKIDLAWIDFTTGTLSVKDNQFEIIGDVDATKKIVFQADTQATGKTLTIDVGAQTDNRNLAAPILTGNDTIAVRALDNAFTATQTITAANGLTTQAAATQDAIRVKGRAGGTGSFIGTVTLTTLSASRTYTLPDLDLIMAGSASALTSGRVPFVTTGGALTDSANFTFSTTVLNIANTTSAISATVGAVTIGNGVAATNVAFGGGRIYAGGTTHRWGDAGNVSASLIASYDQGDIQLMTSGAAAYFDMNIRPASGKNAFLSFTEAGIADRWSIGILGGSGTLNFSTGRVATAGTLANKASLSSAGLWTVTNNIVSTGADLAGATTNSTISLTRSGHTTAYNGLLLGDSAGTNSFAMFQQGSSAHGTLTWADANRACWYSGTGFRFGTNTSSTQYIEYGSACGITVRTGTFTSDVKAFDVGTTWNAAGVTFTAAKVNVTNTASAAGSLLLDLQVASTSQAQVTKGGQILSMVPAGGIGYGTGAGGTQTQGTSRTTGVTLNTVCGAITLFSAAGSTTYQTFTVTNSSVAAADVIRVVQKSGTDLYEIHVTAVAAGSFNITFRTTGGTTVEQPVFSFAVIKAVTA